MKIYVLQHTHSAGDEEDVKLLGVYSSRELAQTAQDRFSERAGYIATPEGFVIDEYVMDADYWTEGFVNG